jgi:hypothetical protein
LAGADESLEEAEDDESEDDPDESDEPGDDSEDEVLAEGVFVEDLSLRA